MYYKKIGGIFMLSNKAGLAHILWACKFNNICTLNI